MSLPLRLPGRPAGWLATLLIALLAMLAMLAMLWAMPGAAQDLPAQPDKPVLDAANVLPPAQEAALDRRLASYNQQTGRAVIVATVPSLGGEPAAMYAQQLAEAWDVGGADTEQGVLLLVAPNEREVFITTARGVQGRLTDLASGRIVREAIIPRFRAGDMPGGITAGVEGIIERLDMDPADARAIDEAEAAAARQARRGGDTNPAAIVGGVIFWGALLIGFALLFGRKGRRGGRRHRRYGAAGAVGDVLLWTAINSTMNSGRDSGGWGGGFGGGSGGGGGFGGFGGGGGGFNGGGAGGSW